MTLKLKLLIVEFGRYVEKFLFRIIIIIIIEILFTSFSYKR